MEGGRWQFQLHMHITFGMRLNPYIFGLRTTMR